MDLEGFAREAFKNDQKLRYIAIVDKGFHLLLSKQREGLPSLTSEEMRKNFMSVFPPIFLETLERLQPYLGTMHSVNVRYEKVLFVAHHTGNLIVVFAFQPEVVTPFMTRTAEAFERLSKQYLS